MWTRRTGSAVLMMLALGSAPGWADDGHTRAPENPDPSFLEFLGSVDRLAEVNPDYLAPAGHAQAAQSPAKGAAPPRPPPSQPPPPPTAASGVKNND
jgi:hypothetical protein